MELKPGYKRTEVGVIPEEWEIRPMAELGKVRTGPFGTLLKADEYTGKDGVPLVSVGEIGEGSFRVTEKTPRVPASVVRRLPQYVLKTGDIVFGRKGAVDRSALVGPSQQGWFLGSDGISLRLSDACNPSYVGWQFQRPEVRAWLIQNAVGTTMASLNQQVLGGVTIPWAPRAEQRAIATALSDVDALLTQLDRLIAKKRDIKQAAMQQLLTGKTRLSGFDGAWQPCAFDEVLERLNVKAHQLQTADYQTVGRYPVVDQGQQPVVGYSDDGERRFVCPPGGVIVFGDHTCIVKFVDFDFLVGADGTQVLQARPGHSTRFLAYELQREGIQQTGYNRHFKFLKDRRFKMPQLAEQTAIATLLSDLDTELATLETRRDKTHALKQGMMQELLTGRIRLA